MKIKNTWIYLGLLVITLIVGFPLLRFNMLNGHDAVFHLFRTNSLKVAINDGQLIPLINHNMMGGFGYAPNLFYGVLSSYGVSLFSIFTPTHGLSVNLFILFSIFLSGVMMYHCVNDISKNKKASFVAALLYMIAPYRLYDIYVRMALGEVIAFVFTPLVFQGIYNIIHDSGNKWYLLTIGTAGLFLTHNLSTFMVGIFSFIYLLLNMEKLKNKEIVKKTFFSLVLAFLISLPSIVPLLEAKTSSDYMIFDSEYMKTTGQQMEARSIDLFTRPSSIFNTSTYLAKIVQIHMVIIGIITIILIVNKIKKKRREDLTFHFYLLSLLSLLLTLNIIPWSKLPTIFSIFQFPWRYLQITSFSVAILLALLVSKLKKGTIVSLLVVFTSFLFSIPMLYSGIHNKGISDQVLNSNSIRKRGEVARSTGTASAEYLPRNAIYRYEYLNLRGDIPVILKGEVALENINKKGTHLSFQANVIENAMIELPFIYYPGYIVEVNDKKIETFETEIGLLGFYLDKGNFNVKIAYRGTFLMIVAYIESLLAWIFLVSLLWKEKLLEKRKIEIKEMLSLE